MAKKRSGMGILHRADDVRRASAGGRADPHVAAAKVQVLQPSPWALFVLRRFHGAQDRFMTPR